MEFSNSNDDNALSLVDALPPHLPANPALQIVHKHEGTLEGNRKELSLNLDMNASTGDAHRALADITQNLIDQMVSANGQHYNGVRLIVGTRKHGGRIEQATVFHNGTHRLAEIINVTEPLGNQLQHFASHEKSREFVPYGVLSFVNYGAVIKSSYDILTIGRSSKRLLPNQIGHFGEGLKLAIAFLLHNGCGVEIECVICTEIRATTHRWRFYIRADQGEKGVIFFKQTLVVPQKIHNKNDDEHHFELRITYPRGQYTAFNQANIQAFIAGGQYNIFDYLVQPIEHLRARNGNDDFGTLIIDPIHRGKLYAWHFFVKQCKPAEMLWSYDLFAQVPRTRDDFNWQQLAPIIARIWNRVIAESEPMCALFYNELIYKDQSVVNSFIERWAIPYLNRLACSRLCKVFRDGYKNEGVHAVLLRNHSDAQRRYRCRMVVVPDHTYSVFFGDHDHGFSPYEAFLGNDTTLLCSSVPKFYSTDPKVMETVKEIIGSSMVEFVERSDCDLIYCMNPVNRRLVLNWDHFKNDTLEQVMPRIMLNIVPFLDPSFGTAAIVNRALHWAPPPPPPKRTVIEIPDDYAPPTDDEKDPDYDPMEEERPPKKTRHQEDNELVTEFTGPDGTRYFVMSQKKQKK